MNKLITIENVSRSFQIGRRQIEVLKGLSFEVEAGEFVALCGASGAGKSTLLHLIGGLDTPNAGRICVAGDDLSKLKDSALSQFRNRHVGFIFQAYHLFPELDALENVALSARILRQPPALAEQKARELLCQVGLADRLDHLPSELSGGEQQRVALARALVNEPALILADEPTGNLDSHTGENIIDLLCALRQERKATLLIATHDSKIAARAPRVLQLVDGQMAGS